MEKIKSALIGFGDFTENVIVPNLEKNGNFSIRSGLVHSKERIDAVEKKYGLEYATIDYDRIVEDPDIQCVFIVSRHDKHKEQIIRALEAGKNVFTEKPMAMSSVDAEEICRTAEKSSAKLMIGFNRRFSPLTLTVKRVLNEIPPPYIINYRWINKAWSSGWPFDPIQGGGKLVSSGCHMIDLCLFLMGALPDTAQASLGTFIHDGIRTHDTASVIMNFGAKGLVNISTGELGAKAMPQERLEIFTKDGVMEIESFCSLKFYDIEKDDILPRDSEKGFKEEFEAFYEYVNSDIASPCGVRDGLNVAHCVDACIESSNSGRAVRLHH